MLLVLIGIPLYSFLKAHRERIGQAVEPVDQVDPVDPVDPVEYPVVQPTGSH